MSDFKNKFSWSKSRDTLFGECKRQYYYNYYGSWGGWDKKTDRVTRMLYVLKNLNTRPQWKGTSVHEEIARVLRELNSTGKLTPIEKSIKRMSELMRGEFKESRTRSYWLKEGSLRNSAALFDHEYMTDLTDDVWREVHDDGVLCIRNFYESTVLEQLTSADETPIITIDKQKPTSFYIGDNKIYVNLDLAYESLGMLEIVDWKTGKSESDNLQFLVYTIYAEQELNYPLHKVRLTEYNLHLQEPILHTFSPEEIEEAKGYIAGSIQEMKELLLDPSQNTARMSDFKRVDNESVCNLCNFKKICFELD